MLSLESQSPLTPEQVIEEHRSREDRYKIGQFFTPKPIADVMAAALNEISPEFVLDPGVGGGVLLRSLGTNMVRYGMDLDATSVNAARASLAKQGGPAHLASGDFLDRRSWPFERSSFDGVIANPPYIRHHNISAEHKALAPYYSRKLGVKVSALSGSYVYFFLESILRLREGGRLVFITPTEFLDVRYGAAVKQALIKHCEIDEVLVLEMNELAFDGVLTTSAITVATKRTGAKRIKSFRLVEGTANGEVKRSRKVDISIEQADPFKSWTPMLPSRMDRIKPLLAGRTSKLKDFARVRRGIATGGNSFFCLRQEAVNDWNIEPQFLVPVLVGSKDLPQNGCVVDEAFWRSGLDEGRPAWLLWCHDSKDNLQGTRVLDYINHGETLGLNSKFNCRTRSPWYSVEKVQPPDFFVTYMHRDNARFIRNLAGARCMTSLLNVWALDGISPEQLDPILSDPANAELLREFGRTYGGGLGKIEPRELLELPVKPVQ